MKVLAHIPLYLPHHNSGAETTAHALFKALTKAGHEVKIILEKTSVEEYDGIPVHRMNYLYGDRKKILNLYEWADVVYTHLGSVGFVDNLTRLFIKRPVVYYAHNSYRSSAVQRGTQYKIVYNSEWVRDELQKVYGEKRNIVCNPIIDTSSLKKKKKGTKITLINANENKGGYEFRDIARSMPDEEFLIVKGSYGTQIVTDLPPNVEVVDNTDKMLPIWEQTKIIVMPSAYESFGRVAVEANYLGIPVVCTPTKGLKESTLNKGNYVMKADIETWVKTIKKINAKYPDYKKKAKAIGKEVIEQNKNHCNNFVKFVENIYNGSKSINTNSKKR